MAQNTPIVGLQDSFSYGTGSPATYTVINGVEMFAISGDKVQTNKTTTMASPLGVDTFIASTQDPGTCDVKGFWYPADNTQVAIEAARLAGTAIPFKGTYGSSNSVSFFGIIECFTPSFPLDKPAMFDLKIKITGTKTYV